MSAWKDCDGGGSGYDHDLLLHTQVSSSKFLISALPACCASNNITLCSQPLTHRAPVSRNISRNKTRTSVTHRTAWLSNFAGIAIRTHQGQEIEVSQTCDTRQMTVATRQPSATTPGHAAIEISRSETRNCHAEVPIPLGIIGTIANVSHTSFLEPA